MKYIILLGDGMADYPIKELSGRTPLEAAKTPIMDEMAKAAEIGLAKVIPDGMKPGSDTANLSVLGYDPQKYYTGRSPLEALSIGAKMSESDVSMRCNLVTVSEDENEYKKMRILDHSAGEISTEEGRQLIEAVRKELEVDGYTFYAGTSYRHLLIWKDGKISELTPPHDILGKVIGEYLPEDKTLYEMMQKSFAILKEHPINMKRKVAGKNPANSIWFWGAGTKPKLSSFEALTGKKAAMISAVDLLKGIAVGAGMKNIEVEGANGGLNTDYEGKAAAAAGALLKENYDFVYVHVEAPDEMGHQGNTGDKIKAIEYLDERLLKPMKQAMDASNEKYRLMVLPDHFTPIEKRTHSGEPIPFMIYDSSKQLGQSSQYNEQSAKESGIFINSGEELMHHFLET